MATTKGPNSTHCDCGGRLLRRCHARALLARIEKG